MKIIKRIILFILMILILTGLLAVYAVKIEPYRLAVHDYELKKGPASIELKLVHISDIQVSEAYSEDRLGKWIRSTGSRRILLFLPGISMTIMRPTILRKK